LSKSVSEAEYKISGINTGSLVELIRNHNNLSRESQLT